MKSRSVLYVTMIAAVLAFGLLQSAESEAGNKTECGNAKEQFKSFNEALARQAKDLKDAHKTILIVAPNRVVGYAQEITSRAAGVAEAAKNLAEQAAMVQKHCVDEKTN